MITFPEVALEELSKEIYPYKEGVLFKITEGYVYLYGDDFVLYGGDGKMVTATNDRHHELINPP